MNNKYFDLEVQVRRGERCLDSYHCIFEGVIEKYGSRTRGIMLPCFVDALSDLYPEDWIEEDYDDGIWIIYLKDPEDYLRCRICGLELHYSDVTNEINWENNTFLCLDCEESLQKNLK